MGLSDDQRAMLRLLAQREEGYEDIAALMGLSVDEVRARVKEALAELGEAGSPVGPVGEGQGVAAAGPVAAGDPPPPAVAEASSGAVPPATPPAEEVPAPTTAERQPPQTVPSPSRSARQPPLMSLPRERRRLIELVGGVLIAVLIVLFATGALDIGGGDSDSGSGGSANAGVATASSCTDVSGGSSNAAAIPRLPENGKLTKAMLKPVDGGDAAGIALFGRLRKTVVLQVQATGLAPSPAGCSYSVWLYRSPKLVLRVGAAKVGENGQLAAQFPIPTELLAYVAGGAFTQVAVSLLSEAEYESALAAAKKKKQLPGYLGADTLRGTITGPAIKQQ